MHFVHMSPSVLKDQKSLTGLRHRLIRTRHRSHYSEAAFHKMFPMKEPLK